MLCINCGKRQATTHIKQTVNGQTHEYHLCPECAMKLGMASFNPFDLSDLWASLFKNDTPEVSETVKCPSCGSTFEQIAKRGKLGCPECYKTFYDELLPSLRKLHGKTHHTGKVPGNADESTKTARELKTLQEQLQAAIESEEYEKAAQLRDQIRMMEQQEGDQ